MQVQLNQSDRQLQEEIRTFLAEQLPESIARKVRLGLNVGKEDLTLWTRLLAARGWAAPNWPVENGGTGWTMMQRHLFDVEARLAHAPPLSGFGFNMVGPAIIRYGTQQQKDFYLPRILAAEDWWCQGYSEPQAGSDLASLSTRAVADGDHYVVDGSKIWTSGAEIANRIFCLVRTNADSIPQKGISFLLIDMDTPGITVKPLYAFNGKWLWNQVFFDKVRVPRDQRLGEDNQGWTVAKNLLGNERLMVSRVSENKRLLSNIRRLQDQVAGRGVLIEDETCSRICKLDLRLQALEATALRLLIEVDQGKQVGAEPSMLKLKGSQLVQDMDAMLLELAGYYGIPIDASMRGEGATSIAEDELDMIASGLFHHRGYTIAGGTSEVQHNIIAKAVLGL